MTLSNITGGTYMPYQLMVHGTFLNCPKITIFTLETNEYVKTISMSFDVLGLQSFLLVTSNDRIKLIGAMRDPPIIYYF